MNSIGIGKEGEEGEAAERRMVAERKIGGGGGGDSVSEHENTREIGGGDSVSEHENKREIGGGDSVSEHENKREIGGGDSDSEDESEDMKKFIIVQTLQTDDDDHKTTGYYMLDLQTEGDVSILPRTVQDQLNPFNMSSMVSLGSKLYIFGKPINNSDDDDEPNPSSYFLDLPCYDSQSKSSLCWKIAHPLTRDYGLMSGCAVGFAGKMYLFRNTDSSCFCEVFDPTEEPEPQWHRINSTPIPTPGVAENNTGIAPPVLPDHKNNRIIVFLGHLCALYAYYPFEDRWECLVECFLVDGRRGWFFYAEPVTIVDGVIYVHRRKLRCIFMAFDIATQQWLNVSMSPDALHSYKVYLPMHYYDSLLHLGKDVLCLLNWRYKDALHTASLIHVVQFKVKLINNTNDGTKEVIVTPLPSRSREYDLHSPCALHHSLAL